VALAIGARQPSGLDIGARQTSAEEEALAVFKNRLDAISWGEVVTTANTLNGVLTK